MSDKRMTEVALSVNAWITVRASNSSELINDDGLHNWTSDQTIISVYFHTESATNFDLFVKCKVLPSGVSKLQFSLENTIHTVDVTGSENKSFRIGEFRVNSAGYHRIDFKGVHKTGSYFADVSHLIVGENTAQESIEWIHENTTQTYWTRRGPSVHLNYKLSNTETFEYFYNEVNVPKGFDPIGSYFMAVGFDAGYYGIQVKSPTERWILFSIWSPQKESDPKNVSPENKVVLLSKGKDVTAENFGNEGSGEHSVLKYNWKTETTYKFLVRGHPDPTEKTHSILTAWFAEEGSEWRLISSFRRPKSGNYLSDFYSFNECFDGNYTYLARKARYGNQWVCNSSGNWSEVTIAQFTGDETAQKKYRLDFEGGVELEETKSHQHFYLKNCGFFNSNVKLSTQLIRIENKVKPKIDFTHLPQ